MVSTSKVLTVSYGTFSCTLEGFDDSFDTMKAIAEYFRDLAADDRYFGAEPPTPDAEMLARIAEKEIARRVEARLEGDSIVLRTALPGAGVPEADPAPVADPVEPSEAAAGDTPIAPSDADESRSEDHEDAAPQAPETVAPSDQAPDQKDTAEDTIAAVGALLQDAETSDDAPSEAAASDTDDLPGAAPEADSGTIAAKLARIRAVVGNPGAGGDTAGFTEDEHADEILDTLPGDTDLEDILPAEPAQERSDATPQEDTIANVMDQIAASDSAVQEPAADQPAEAAQADETPAEVLTDEGAPRAQPAADSVTDAEPEKPAASVAEATPRPVRVQAGAVPKPVDEDPGAKDAAQTPEPEQAPAAEQPEAAPAPRRPIRARVIKMKRAEFEKAVADGDLEEVQNDTDSSAQQPAPEAAPSAPTPEPQTSLSSDDEDELQRELAAVEAELAGIPTDAPQAEVLQSPSAEASAALDLDQAPEAEMDRLMSQTSDELDHPESKQRRNAMGHMRAAVAAARADKTALIEGDGTDQTEAYRGDLQDAVRPARPERPERPNRRAQAEQPVQAAPPPLKLVAEQRVDVPQETPNLPAAAVETAPQVVPAPRRRIRADNATRAAIAPEAPVQTAQPAPAKARSSNPAIIGDAEGTFQEFADEMGATELPDLLEAAAAYLAFVEGREQFSRPQLMTKVRMVQEDNFSREDGLRSFGQLLRQGKIEKISGGRFTVSDRISFKPDTREAG
ncbi:MAG: hypothetical protein AAF891_00785 [Pseudomonadota bacterium]